MPGSWDVACSWYLSLGKGCCTVFIMRCTEGLRTSHLCMCTGRPPAELCPEQGQCMHVLTWMVGVVARAGWG